MKYCTFEFRTCPGCEPTLSVRVVVKQKTRCAGVTTLVVSIFNNKSFLGFCVLLAQPIGLAVLVMYTLQNELNHRLSFNLFCKVY